MTMFLDPNEAQKQASNPGMNTFVSANAGSGKTTILTNRISRLLFHGVRPENILCATFTKAAAGEVQNRIFQNLSEWVMISDEALVDALAKIGEHVAFEDKKALQRARRLFANALDTPGGLKVQTIHAFAARLLRIFPLEAGISPNFRELDDDAASGLLVQAMQSTARAYPELYLRFRSQTELAPQSLMEALVKHSSAFSTPPVGADMARELGLEMPHDDDAVISDFVSSVSPAFAKGLASVSPKGAAAKWLFVAHEIERGAEFRDIYLALWAASLKVGGEPNNEVLKLFDKLNDHSELQEFLNRFDATKETLAKHRYVKDAEIIGQFGFQVRQFYERLKAQKGYLDYNDLIEKAVKLLNRDNMMNWVMYRMDAQIEHVLIDEAQDTNQSQWAIVEALTENFYKDASRKRTVFVVGDEKQSIFSFQGADPRLLSEYKSRFSKRISNTGFDFQERDLLHSFRTAPPILKLVDAVFASRTKSAQEVANHIPFKTDMAGRVDIWPFLVEESEDLPRRTGWVQAPPKVTVEPQVQLASYVAKYIHECLAQNMQLVGHDRKVEPQDFLILVRKRNAFFDAVIPALRDLGVPVAGIDRIQLKEQLAVNDVLALLRFLVQPRDDLSLAATLRSPLFGLSEAGIFELAYVKRQELQTGGVRRPSLFQALKSCGNYTHVLDDIAFLRANTEYRRPFDMISLILDRLHGEEKLRTHLGGVAKDALEGLLEAANSYETTETPSLVGFLTWFDNQDIEIKRALAKPDREVRIMTVHGAKGLEAPIVIAPIFPEKQDRSDSLAPIGGHIVRTKSGIYGREIQALRDAEKLDAAREKDRLLYVALTRAENHLVLCGAGKDPSFLGEYEPISEAFDHCFEDAKTFDMAFGQARFFETDLPAKTATAQDDRETLIPPNFDSAPQYSLSPRGVTSILQDLDKVEYETSGDSFRGKDFGNAVHDLLDYGYLRGFQNLEAIACTLGIDELLVKPAVAEVERVFETYPALFGADSAELERAFVVDLPTGLRITGRFDYLRVDNDVLTVVDFKTNGAALEYLKSPPATYLEQLAIYRFALTQLFPEYQIRAGLLWTAIPELQMIEDERLSQSYEAVLSRLKSQ